MATYVPPKRATEYIFYVMLRSQADTKLFQANPTLAAGDVKVSKDGGAFANLGTLPAVTPAGGRAVKVTLSAAEMTADNVVVQFVDAAGAEWCDLAISIQTAARQIDDLAFPTTSGRSLDVTVTGAAGIDWANVENQSTAVDLSATTTNLVNTVTTYTGNTVQTGDSFARIGAAGAGLTDLGGMSTTMKGQVQTECDDAIAARFTFTVAGFVDANVQAVNDTTVLGTGTSADPWGP